MPVSGLAEGKEGNRAAPVTDQSAAYAPNGADWRTGCARTVLRVEVCDYNQTMNGRFTQDSFATKRGVQ